jgi:RNase H-like domain found in reverse transcriptase
LASTGTWDVRTASPASSSLSVSAPLVSQALLLELMQQMGTTQHGGDLEQYVAALNWMRSSLPLLSEKVEPLQDLPEVVYKEAKGRTKKKATSASLDRRWTTECEKAFRSLQEDIVTLMTTAHPDPKQRIYVFTEASDAFFSGMVTQVPENQLDLAVQDQQHQPLDSSPPSSGALKNAGQYPRRKHLLSLRR